MDKISRIANREAWCQRLERFKIAGKTVAQFCSDEGVSVPSFYQWRRKLNPKVNADNSLVPLADAKFVSVKLPATPSPKPTTVVSLQLPGGVHLRVEVPSEQEPEQ